MKNSNCKCSKKPRAEGIKLPAPKDGFMWVNDFYPHGNTIKQIPIEDYGAGFEDSIK